MLEQTIGLENSLNIHLKKVQQTIGFEKQPFPRLHLASLLSTQWFTEIISFSQDEWVPAHDISPTWTHRTCTYLKRQEAPEGIKDNAFPSCINGLQATNYLLHVALG